MDGGAVRERRGRSKCDQDVIRVFSSEIHFPNLGWVKFHSEIGALIMTNRGTSRAYIILLYKTFLGHCKLKKL